ncbi:MAG: hypothetical protein MJK12_15760 [Colwellia sp.]|nr:hypothetical protein [Colwellia sp.]
MNVQKIKTISLLAIFSITLSACGGGSEDSVKVIPPIAIIDSDGDGVEDSKDAFPNDASESVDTDGDGVGDNADVFPTDVTEWADENNNGIGDNADALQVNIGGPTGEEGDCSAVTEGINWDALFTKNCSKLSDYNLFQVSYDPTDNPNPGGIPYSLSTALFTDYATKYRYVFIPQGGKAEYTQSEVLNFPVGSVLVKTFAMPADTSSREGEELVIETRLLIHRSDGWMALPYYWNTEDDATLAIAGKLVENTVTIHNGEELNFTYAVPKATSCTSCHARAGVLKADISPIGPKARFLNIEHEYSSGTENQLKHLEQMQLLTGLPSDISTVEKPLVFNDSIEISLLSDEELIDTTEGYLDINCAHCHRDGGAGAAGASGLQLEYQRVFSEETAKFGVCKTPVAGGHQDYSYDVVPGDPDSSYLHFRMNTTDPRHKMPELGRSIVHTEGVALVREWITRLQAPSCP